MLSTPSRYHLPSMHSLSPMIALQDNYCKEPDNAAGARHFFASRNLQSLQVCAVGEADALHETSCAAGTPLCMKKMRAGRFQQTLLGKGGEQVRTSWRLLDDERVVQPHTTDAINRVSTSHAMNCGFLRNSLRVKLRRDLANGARFIAPAVPMHPIAD